MTFRHNLYITLTLCAIMKRLAIVVLIVILIFAGGCSLKSELVADQKPNIVTGNVPADAPGVCENKVIDKDENCDPPGSSCTVSYLGQSVNGICEDDCTCKFDKGMWNY